jgi:spore photoproduct lyase
MPESASFHPSRVLFEQASLDYPLGRRLWDRFSGSVDRGVAEVQIIPSHNRVTGLPGRTAGAAYLEAKRTLVVGVRRGLDFASCRPSADYQLPLVTSCPGLCEYCYLQTTLGRRPYVRVYVNVEDILARAGELARAGGLSMADRPVSFEGAAVGDPVPVEPLTGALAEAVRFFALQENARFRFVTKFPDVDGLLDLDHRGHTRARVTLNTERVIRDFDHGTPPLETRLDTLARLIAAGYPTGAMIAPVFLEGDWRREYENLFERLGRLFGSGGPVAPPRDASQSQAPSRDGPLVSDMTLEVVTHRFTATARRIILERYPESHLPMDEEGRVRKRGQFGYFKYVYPKAELDEVRVFFTGLAERYLPEAAFDYLV